MYDWSAEKWVFRQTDVMIAVPEIWGHVAVGRTKEGFSMNKVMIGYGGWTMERQPINDATLPILADGIKWLGYVPKARILWNLGFYGDAVSEGETFSTYENQLSGRFAWVPILSTDGGNLLHIGFSHRYGKPNNGKMRLKARPGAWAAPFFVDTAEFAASRFETQFDRDVLAAAFGYVRRRALLPEDERTGVRRPVFPRRRSVRDVAHHRRDAHVQHRGGYFNQVSPSRPVLPAGPAHGRSWCTARSRTSTTRRSGRQVLAADAHAELVSLGSREARVRLRIQLAQSIWTVGKAQFFQTRIQFQL